MERQPIDLQEVDFVAVLGRNRGNQLFSDRDPSLIATKRNRLGSFQQRGQAKVRAILPSRVKKKKSKLARANIRVACATQLRPEASSIRLEALDLPQSIFRAVSGSPERLLGLRR